MRSDRLGAPTQQKQVGILTDVPPCLLSAPANLELVSKELNHFGVVADLFRQIGGHNVRSVKKDTKCSSVLLLCLVFFFTERTLVVDLCYFALFEDFSL